MKTCIKTIVGFVALFVSFAMALVSCGQELGPDNGTDPKVDEAYEAWVDSLENALYRQARAMQIVLTPSDEPVLVSSCVAEDVDNLYSITLSTGASFSILIDESEDYADALSYVEIEGKNYWAICDKDGNIVAVEDAEGSNVEVSTSVDVKIVDKKYFLNLGDAEYEMGYGEEDNVQIFDCVVLKDDAGDVYAVVFDFGEGKTKILYVAEYSGLYYYLPSDQSKTTVQEMYVNKEGKATLAVNLSAQIAWQPIVDEGWNATLRKDGEISYVDIIAPSQYEVTEEYQPQLKAVSLDGTATFATVNLTNVMYRAFAISVTDVVIAPSTGLGKFAYGVSLLDDFNAQEITELAPGLIAGTAEPSAGNSVSDIAVSKSFADILGSPLDPEERYVLWAYADGQLRYMEFGEIAVRPHVESTSLLDAQITVSVSGAEKIFGGIIEKTDDMVETILYQVNNQICDPIATIDQKFVYTGAASDFPVVDSDKYTFMPDSEYAIWVVPCVDGEYIYTEKDLTIEKFKTNQVVPGGSLEITCGEPVVTPSTISFPLSCEGAQMIYYAYFTAEGGERYSGEKVPNNVRFDKMISQEAFVKQRYVTVFDDEVNALATNLNDEGKTTYWLFAVAVDSEGRYGKVHFVSAQTLQLAYDDKITLSVSADKNDVTSNSIVYKVTSTGGDLSDYIYWVGSPEDDFWRNKCEGYRDGARKYMALNPADEEIQKSMKKYGKIAEDGTIVITDLLMGTDYIFIILEKGDVYYSYEGYKKQKTLEVNLGTVIREGTDKWNEAKSKIEIEWRKDKFEQPPHLLAYYAFDFKCPTDLTAYILCAGDGYYEERGFIKKEHFMIDIETYSSRPMDVDYVPTVNGEFLHEPDYYKNNVFTEGQLMSVNDFYVHGSPLHGSVTYFASGSHDNSHCTSWENGVCSNYERALSWISYYQSLEPYTQRAAAFGLKGDEAANWAKALQAAYGVFYNNAKPMVYVNDGSPLYVVNASAMGVNEEGIVTDRVYVMFKDLQGNYYEPMSIEVPNYFEKE